MGIPIDEELLRRLMCHSDRTANKWYLRESLTEQAAEASVQIEFHTKPSKEDPNAKPSKEDPNAKPLKEDPNAKPSKEDPNAKPSKEDRNAKLSVSSKPKPDDDRSIEKSAEASPAEDILQRKDGSVTLAPSGSSSKHSLSAAQRKQIEKVFVSDIQSGIEPRRKRIVAVMKSDPILQTLAT